MAEKQSKQPKRTPAVRDLEGSVIRRIKRALHELPRVSARQRVLAYVASVLEDEAVMGEPLRPGHPIPTGRPNGPVDGSDPTAGL